MNSTLLFAVPEEDIAEYQALPDSVRADVDDGLTLFEIIHAAAKVSPACKEAAARHPDRRGFSFDSLRRKYYSYVETGDWRVLVDHARVSRHGVEAEKQVKLPKDFIDYLKGLFQSNQRKSEPAIRLVYRLWRRGESVPGYGTWQEWFLAEHEFHPLPAECPPELPRGWSKGNLRRYIPEDAELALARRGIAAARQQLPHIIMTREGLRPLELIMFDDVRTDFKILVKGFAAPVELNLLVAMDVATGMILRYGLRPAIIRSEDGKRDRLKLHDMKHLLAGMLLMWGAPKHYKTHLLFENAVATVQDATADAIRELSCGQIEVQKTMMIQGTALFGGYKDKTFGNPQGKGPLESTFNLLHNEAAFLPGQTGRRYDEGPAELQGRTDENKALEKVSRFLTPHDRARLKRPFLNAEDARVVVTDIFRQMINRGDHAMEGFKLVGEWRFKDFEPWRLEGELPSGIDMALVQWRNPARLETPFERWNRLVAEVGGAGAFQKLHPGAIMRLYDGHIKKTIDNSEICMKEKNETFVYRIADVQHARLPLQNEMDVLVYFDPQDRSVIHLTDGKGGFLGSIPRTRGARRLDKAAMKENMEKQRARLNELRDTVSDRMPHVVENHLAALEDNNAILEEAKRNQEAIELAPDLGSPQLPTPKIASDLLRAKLQAQVQGRQIAAQDPTTPINPVPEDCTKDLLAREGETQATDTWE